MSNPVVRTSGSLSTDGVVAPENGLLTYAEAVGGTLVLYDSLTTGTTNNQICTVTSSGRAHFAVPLKYNDGLYATISAGSFVIHGTNVAKTT